MIDANRTRIGGRIVCELSRICTAESVQLDDVSAIEKGLEQGPGIALVIPPLKESLLRSCLPYQ